MHLTNIIDSQGVACNTIARGLNDDQRQAILDRHNDLRRRIASGQERSQHPASNMKKLVKLDWFYMFWEIGIHRLFSGLGL